jgi:hypothetical protein
MTSYIPMNRRTVGLSIRLAALTTIVLTSACGSASPANELQATNATPTAGITLHVAGPNVDRTIDLPSDPGLESRTAFEHIAFSAGDQLTFTAMLNGEPFAEKVCTVNQLGVDGGIVAVIVDYSQTTIICALGFEL